MAELEGKTFGHYQLHEPIGNGGMATVYRATDQTTGRTVALKILSPFIAREPRFKARFEREIALQRKLTHPHIAPILEAGELDGYHYIVMPFFATGTLHDRMQKGALSVREAARVMDQMSEALTFAHSQGIVHRDVKPSNILVDENGDMFLSDFGFAYVPDSGISLTGSLLIGTPAYMSPEQCRGEEVGPSSDEYSLGVVLYQLATGRLPFDGDTPLAVVVKHASEPLPKPRGYNPNLPEPVEDVLIRALAKHPAERYASVGELNAAFHRSLDEARDPSQKSSRFDRSTEMLPKVVVRKKKRTWQRPAVMAGIAVAFLVACPATAWALGYFPAIFGGTPSRAAAAGVSGDDLQGTISALSTFNAAALGAMRMPGEVETAVAATISAQGIIMPTGEAGSADGSPTPTATPSLWLTQPSNFLALTTTAGPTSRTGGGSPGASPTSALPTNTPGPGATWTPTSPSLPTDTAIAPTDTPVPPTDTPVPPTDTPVPPTPLPPTKTPKCAGHSCTPTPTPG